MDNRHDLYAVAAVKNELAVGHVPCKILLDYSISIQCGWCITCIRRIAVEKLHKLKQCHLIVKHLGGKILAIAGESTKIFTSKILHYMVSSSTVP